MAARSAFARPGAQHPTRCHVGFGEVVARSRGVARRGIMLALSGSCPRLIRPPRAHLQARTICDGQAQRPQGLPCAVLPPSFSQSDPGGGRRTGRSSDSTSRHSPPCLDARRPRRTGPDGRAPAQLNPSHRSEHGRQRSAALTAAAERKHAENERKCRELGWACVPMAVTTYGEWGEEAEKTIFRICERLAMASGAKAAQVHAGVRQQLSVVLMRENGRALLASLCPGLGRAELEAGGHPTILA